jgi:pyrroline-5-carboxylate reductase
MSETKYAFIGAGNMSGAILGGMVESGIDANSIMATNRTQEKQKALHDKYGVITHLTNKEAIEQADVIILGVKPQMMFDVLTQLVADGVVFSEKLIITVAAGLHCERYKEILGNVRFIRCMPNTPSLVGLGVSGLYMDTDSSTYSAEQLQADKETAAQMFGAVGQVYWLERESQIDDISAVTGSSPAYFFLFMEAMMDKAISLGFAEQDAKQMVQQTMLGSAKMAFNTDESFAQLRKNVTSPGGSTAEAIKHFEQQNIRGMVDGALDAAIHRAKEMSKL